MKTTIIIIHLLIVISLVGVILIQSSEGGGFRFGNFSGIMNVRSTKNIQTRLTSILAILFFATSIILTVMQAISPLNREQKILQKVISENINDKTKNIQNPKENSPDKKLNITLPKEDDIQQVPRKTS